MCITKKVFRNIQKNKKNWLRKSFSIFFSKNDFRKSISNQKNIFPLHFHPSPPIIYTINVPNNPPIYKRNTHSPPIFFKSKLNHIPQLSKSPIFTSSLRTPTSSTTPPIFKHLTPTSSTTPPIFKHLCSTSNF